MPIGLSGLSTASWAKAHVEGMVLLERFPTRVSGMIFGNSERVRQHLCDKVVR